MDFDPAFDLLIKFAAGLPPQPISEADVAEAARYIGLELPVPGAEDVDLRRRIALVAEEIARQNLYLNHAISSDAIFASDEYRKSMFIREVVANNRRNLEARRARGQA